MKERIKQLVGEHLPELVAIRHHLHRHPELSYKEFKTAQFIQSKLKEWDIPFRAPVAETGVIGLIEGKNPGKKTIALRADLDALPVSEENDLPFKSENEGVMHACGHDIHMTCLLGASKILSQLKSEWEGTIKLIFQPGEERAPGGASLMIKEGALENPRPEAILGLHVQPELEVGKVGFRPGIAMASADEIFITVKGPGGHAAYPFKTTDTILVASHIVVALQQLISRRKDPFSPSVLSISAFNGGHTTNVIPTEVKLIGTFRAMDEKWRIKAHELIRRTANGIGEAMDAEVEVIIPPGYPCLKNEEQLTMRAQSLAEAYLGKSSVTTTDLRMGAEDFAFYSQEIPACFFRLGVGNISKGMTANVHSPHFLADENAIGIGVGMMAFLGWALLK